MSTSYRYRINYGNGSVSSDIIGAKKACREIAAEKQRQYRAYAFLERYEASPFAEEPGYWQRVQWSNGA